MSTFPRVQSRPLADLVADALLEHITAQALEPGSRLPTERDLGEQFGVSRTVVREAIRSLAARGVVKSRAGSGLVVAAVPAEIAREALSLYLHGRCDDRRPTDEFRLLLEVQVASLAAEHGTPEALAALAAPAAEADSRRVAETEAAVHRALAAASGNPLYALLVDALVTALVDTRATALAEPAARARTAHVHAHLVERVLARDATGAADAMRACLAEVSG